PRTAPPPRHVSTLSLHDALPIFAAPHMYHAQLHVQHQTLASLPDDGRAHTSARPAVRPGASPSPSPAPAALPAPAASPAVAPVLDRKSTPSELQSRENLVCRLLL